MMVNYWDGNTITVVFMGAAPELSQAKQIKKLLRPSIVGDIWVL
jgi:hypothetical protein